MKQTTSNIKIADAYHEVNGDEFIWITYVYKGKTIRLCHEVESIKNMAKDEFTEAFEGNIKELNKIRKLTFSKF